MPCHGLRCHRIEEQTRRPRHSPQPMVGWVGLGGEAGGSHPFAVLVVLSPHSLDVPTCPSPQASPLPQPSTSHAGRSCCSPRQRLLWTHSPAPGATPFSLLASSNRFGAACLAEPRRALLTSAMPPVCPSPIPRPHVDLRCPPLRQAKNVREEAELTASGSCSGAAQHVSSLFSRAVGMEVIVTQLFWWGLGWRWGGSEGPKMM